MTALTLLLGGDPAAARVVLGDGPRDVAWIDGAADRLATDLLAAVPPLLEGTEAILTAPEVWLSPQGEPSP